MGTGEQLKKLEGHIGDVYCVSFNPSNPTLLVSASSDRTVRLWVVRSAAVELRSGTLHQEKVLHVDMCFFTC